MTVPRPSMPSPSRVSMPSARASPPVRPANCRISGRPSSAPSSSPASPIVAPGAPDEPRAPRGRPRSDRPTRAGVSGTSRAGARRASPWLVRCHCGRDHPRRHQSALRACDLPTVRTPVATDRLEVRAPRAHVRRLSPVARRRSGLSARPGGRAMTLRQEQLARIGRDATERQSARWLYAEDLAILGRLAQLVGAPTQEQVDAIGDIVMTCDPNPRLETHMTTFQERMWIRRVLFALTELSVVESERAL